METKSYIDWVNEGVDLLKRHQDPNMRLTAYLFANPFHVALGLKPATGGLINWHQNGLTAQSHPSLKAMLGNATHILTDRDCKNGRDVYGKEWHDLHLEIVEETSQLVLLKIPESQKLQP